MSVRLVQVTMKDCECIHRMQVESFRVLLAETLIPNASRWQPDTILQEQKLCRSYERLGCRRTGAQETIQPGMDIVFCEKCK